MSEDLLRLRGELQAALAAEIERRRVPGAVFGVLHRGRSAIVAAGVAHRPSGRPLAESSRFLISSVAKVMTATLVMHLSDRELLSLEDRPADVVPELKGWAADGRCAIRIDHLLSHTSGLDDLALDTGDRESGLSLYATACADLPLLFPPGKRFSYSNAGYAILGRAVERLTGKPWPDALSQHLLQPLGLSSTSSEIPGPAEPEVAEGHVLIPATGEELVVPRHLTSPWSMAPQGRVYSTVADLLRFGAAHLEEGDAGGLLSAASRERLRQPVLPVHNAYYGEATGRGWAVMHRDGRLVLGASGNGFGQVAEMRVIPEERCVFAFLANGYVGAAPTFWAMLSFLYRPLLGISAEEPADLAAKPAPVADLERYAGVYQRLAVRAEVEAGRDGLLLRTESKGGRRQLRLTPVSPTCFLAELPRAGTYYPVYFPEADRALGPPPFVELELHTLRRTA